MPRKVFISVLGLSNYINCQYQKDGFLSPSVRFIQEATIAYHLDNCKWSSEDLILILMTKGARSANWVDNGHIDHNTGEIIKCEGLQTRLKNMQLPCSYKTLEDLPDGNSEEEIWEIFNRVFDVLNEDDDIYFDITHGFRFLPMLVLTLAFYSKFLKRTNVISVTYGNYESRNKSTNIAPIIDLTSLPAVLDWSFAAGQFIENGSINRMLELSMAELNPILKDPSKRNENIIQLKKYIDSLEQLLNEFVLCRGVDIIEGASIKKIKTQAEKHRETFISPLNPIFAKINSSISSFKPESNTINTIYAARWCFDKGLYQQAATILQEGIVSFFAVRHNIKPENEEERRYVNYAFAYLADNTIFNSNDSIPCKVREILTDEMFSNRDIINKFSHLTKVRNDYNHSGMRSRQAPLKPIKLKSAIKDCLCLFEELLCSTNNKAIDEPIDNIFINLSNHQSDKWGKKQLSEAIKYGRIVDIPFPAIDTDEETDSIAILANEYLNKIKDIASPHNAVVHLMGEQTFCHSLLQRLHKAGYKCLASTSKRCVQDSGDNERNVVFHFEKFREYEWL